jgi:hypothetical protein
MASVVHADLPYGVVGVTCHDHNICGKNQHSWAKVGESWASSCVHPVAHNCFPTVFQLSDNTVAHQLFAELCRFPGETGMKTRQGGRRHGSEGRNLAAAARALGGGQNGQSGAETRNEEDVIGYLRPVQHCEEPAAAVRLASTSPSRVPGSAAERQCCLLT